MKLKYYLRGLGIGMIAATLILMIAFSNQKTELSDAEIIERAEALGMVMKEDILFIKNPSAESEQSDKGEHLAGTEEPTESEMAEEVSETEEREWYHLFIPSGSVPRTICRELEKNGVIADAEGLRQYLSDVGYAKSIITGAYEIPYGAENEEIYEILKAGPNR